MAAPLVFRSATPEDAPQILELLEPFVQQRVLLRRTEPEIAALTRHGFLALEGETAVGFAAVEIYSRKLAEVQCLAVHEGHQHRGIGRELVQRCLERSREMGVLEVLAISSSEHFLESCGFRYSLPGQKKALFCQLRPRHDEEGDGGHDPVAARD